MSGYYVRRQGDDSDYLEHAFIAGAGSGGRSSGHHKYLAKLPTPGGGFRYIYDQASLLAARAGHAVSKVIGLEARGRMNRLGAQRQRILKGNGSRGLNAVNQAYNSAKSSYNKSILGRAENAANAARKAIGNAVGEARKRGEGVVGSIKKGAYAVGGQVAKATGLEARGRMNRLGAQRQRMLKGSGKGLHGVNKAYNAAKSSYNKSILGRAENTFNSARGAVSGAVSGARNAASNAVGKARAKGQSAIDAAVGAGRGAANNVRKTATETLRSTGMNRGERRRTKQNLDRTTAERDRLERGIEAARVKNGEFYDPNDKLEIARDRARRRAQAKVNSATTAYNNAHSKGKRRRT